MTSQVVFTQLGSSQIKPGGKTDKFIDVLIKMNEKTKSLDSLSETAKKSLIFNLSVLKDETKWKKMSDLFLEQVDCDRASRLSAFAHAWFNMIYALPEHEDVEILAVNMLIFLIDVMMKKDVAIPKFFLMYNDFESQLSKLRVENVKAIVSHITEIIKRIGENEENEGTENLKIARFNQRWKDFVALVIRRVADFELFEFNDQEIDGKEAAREILFMWIRLTQNQDAFELLVDISSSNSFLVPINERFCDEVIAEEISIDLEKDETIEEEKKRRIEMTWKAIILTKVIDKDRHTNLWNAIITAWKIPDDITEIEENTQVFVKCLYIGKKVLSTSVDVAKKFLGLIRTEKYRLLESQIAFALAIIQCGFDRNDSLADMKKTLQKLFRAGELAEECVWMSENVCGKLLWKVDSQLKGLVKLMEKNEELRAILTEPLFVLMISLLETPAYQKQVVIVDGKVADGCSLWILAKHILSEICVSQASMSNMLSHLFQTIGSASSNNSALILIDVLRVVVKKWSVEILNNSKLIDGLFDYVCRMRRDIAVSLIRCLLPIINSRRQLRESLFKSLKKDLLNDSTVCSAVPILLMLLRSVSKKKGGGGGQFDHSMSQSFGSFSTQSLNAMGCKKNIDANVGLELIGIVRKCLQQPVTTKIELYNGICELATQSSTMVSQFLDMLLSHASNLPEWNMTEMITANKSVVQLNEPLPHFIQTIECLMGELSFADPDFQQEGTEEILNKSKEFIDSWILLATRKDIDDLGLDRNSDWNTNNISGKTHFLFAQMMLSVYDVLIEHLWRRIDGNDEKSDCDRLVALMNRRKELDNIYRERLLNRKETKTSDGEKQTPLDTSQTDILTSAKTLASVMTKLLTANSNADAGNNTTINVRPEILANVQMELLYWTVQRAKGLSNTIVKEYRPLHSIVSGTNSLISLSKSLLEFYVGNEIPDWMNEIETGSVVKTLAIESYANIIQFLTIKYKSTPAKIAMTWFEEIEGEDEEARKKRQEPNILILRHAHSLSCGLFRHVLRNENDDISAEKKANPMHEAQGKAILKATTNVLMMTKNVKVWTNLFKRAVKILEKHNFG
ncbi:unnamed protein product [Caenorhabditis angaria]|uniref:Uncharacterized protein n=1 Tax=Caenorhabditis angaria TaxID=860376 RepID=A0A9P1I503_9PELO|nr:unnamed protein product [Caenorhabditis angaria]